VERKTITTEIEHDYLRTEYICPLCGAKGHVWVEMENPGLRMESSAHHGCTKCLASFYFVDYEGEGAFDPARLR
jgi:hypothetical protein